MKRYVIQDVHDEDPEASGVRPSHSPFDERPTGKVQRADLDRLLAEDRQRAQAEEREQHPDPSDRTRVISRASVVPRSELPPPRTLELDLGPKDRLTPWGFVPMSLPPPPLAPFEWRRAARDEARRTKRIVVAIWAFALTLAGGLGYFVAIQN